MITYQIIRNIVIFLTMIAAIFSVLYYAKYRKDRYNRYTDKEEEELITTSKPKNIDDNPDLDDDEKELIKDYYKSESVKNQKLK